MFKITDDQLTDAIFNHTTLNASGSGTKGEARRQARALLAGPVLLSAAKALLVEERAFNAAYEAPGLEDAIARAE